MGNVSPTRSSDNALILRSCQQNLVSVEFVQVMAALYRVEIIDEGYTKEQQEMVGCFDQQERIRILDAPFKVRLDVFAGNNALYDC